MSSEHRISEKIASVFSAYQGRISVLVLNTRSLIGSPWLRPDLNKIDLYHIQSMDVGPLTMSEERQF